ncbi:MAG: dihydroorotase [Acidiferrobacteraceae bacterium]
MRLLIRNGRVVDPLHGVDAVRDLHVVDGLVVAPARDFSADETIDASGLIVCPGLVDLRARMRDPSPGHKATFASEGAAALAGGITALCCPPDTEPVIDTPAIAERIRTRSERALPAVYPLGALTRGLGGQQLADLATLDRAGCVGFSNGLQPLRDAQVQRRAMEYAASFGLTVFLYPEDAALRGNGVVHEGEISARLGLPGIPEAAETVAVARDLALVEYTGARVHLCQLTSLRAIEMVSEARGRGLPVTADTAAHYLHLSERDIGFFDTHCHVRPPFRSVEDREGLRSALRDGILSAVCSDHQPHEPDAKLTAFSHSEPGVSGLETLLALMMVLVEERQLSLTTAIAAVTCGPAGLLGIDAGHLGSGAPADVCLLDPGYRWVLTAENMISRGRNNPFIGREFGARVVRTLIAGETVFRLDAAGIPYRSSANTR